jgi:hypothetical protein
MTLLGKVDIIFRLCIKRVVKDKKDEIKRWWTRLHLRCTAASRNAS